MNRSRAWGFTLAVALAIAAAAPAAAQPARAAGPPAS